LHLVNRKPRHRLQAIIKKLQTKKQKQPGVTIKTFLDVWDRDGPTSGPTPC